MEKKDKQKILKFSVIIFITLIIFIVGYFINIRSNYEENDLYKEYNSNNTELVYKNQGNNNTKNLDSKQEKNNIEDKNSGDEEEYIKVDIKGAINKPMVYSINKDKRVSDLIDLAGGLKENADTLRLNLSKKLNDEEVIYVYEKGEEDKSNILNMSIQKNDSSDDKGGNKDSGKNKININTASLEELKTLPGIGEAKATSIIEYREENNGFKSIDDLKNISGIGDKTISKFADKVDIRWLLL